jgi:3-isopropylmalate dehydrogenase
MDAPRDTPLVALMPGDGIGAEVLEAAKIVLQTAMQSTGSQSRFEEALLGGRALENRRDPVPPDSLALARRADAILAGAVGDQNGSTCRRL